MAWIDGYIISGGEYENSIIGITPYCPDSFGADVWTNLGEGYRNQTGELYWYNTNFNEQIEVTSIVDRGVAPQGGMVLAKVNLVHENVVTGRFCIKLVSADTTSFNILCYIENAAGNLLGYVPRNSTSSGHVYPRETQMQGSRHFYLALCVVESGGKKNIGWCINSSLINASGNPWIWGERQFRGGYFDQKQIYNTFGIHGDLPTPKRKSPEFGESSKPQGGYNDTPDTPHGTFDFHSEEIPISPKPSLGVTSAGFINVYKIGLNELQDLGKKLFPHFQVPEFLADPSTLTVPEMLSILIKAFYGTIISPAGSTIALADNLGIVDILMNGKLIDYVLDCHVIPTSISGATVESLRIGYRTFSEYQLARATEDYVDIDCGSLNIKECFGNFLDYNCKVECFLPFVGFVPIANEYWNNATIQVHYRFNIIDGSFQARLVATRDNDGKEGNLSNSVIGQYGGVCCVHFPITGLQYSNVVAGLVNGSASAVVNGTAGNYAGVATDLMNMASLKPDTPMSNGYNASSSFLGQRIPYLVIKYPAPQFSENYPSEIGLPLNVMYTLSTLSGFTVIDNPVLNINCSDDEYNEIVSLLKTGVIL